MDIDRSRREEKMKATLVEYPYIVDTGDECKGYRPKTLTCRALLCEDNERRVLFLANHYGGNGEFFEITGTRENGNLILEGSASDYRVPDGPLKPVEEILYSNSEIRSALMIPDLRRFIQEMRKQCDRNIKTA